jgi:integration host factor subunit beta
MSMAHRLVLITASDFPSCSNMTRSDLVARLAERFGQLTQRDAEFAVKTILDAMSEALAKGHRIEIRGFGSFSINRRPPRMGRNPRSGEQVLIPEKLVPHFKPGKALREGVDSVDLGLGAAADTPSSDNTKS